MNTAYFITAVYFRKKHVWSTQHDLGVFKKTETENPNRKLGTRTEFSGIQTEIFNLFGSGIRTDNFFGLSIRTRVGLFTQTGTRKPEFFLFFIFKINRLIFTLQIGNKNVMLCGVMYIDILFYDLKYK